MEKKKVGRPTLYSEKLAVEFCSKIVNGETIKSICKSENMPSVVTIFSWLAKESEFLNLYNKAKEDQSETLADEILELTDEPPKTYVNQQGSEVVDSAWVTWQNNRANNRKWIASRFKPKKFGERLDLGNADDKPLQINCNIPLGFNSKKDV